MSRQEPETNRTKAADAGSDRANLDRQYGSIGISAVAAALPFVGKPKRSAHSAAGDDRVAGDRSRRSVLAL